MLPPSPFVENANALERNGYFINFSRIRTAFAKPFSSLWIKAPICASGARPSTPHIAITAKRTGLSS